VRAIKIKLNSRLGTYCLVVSYINIIEFIGPLFTLFSAAILICTSQTGNARFYLGITALSSWTLCGIGCGMSSAESEQPTAKSVKRCSAASETKHKKPDRDGAQQEGPSCPYPFASACFYHGVLLFAGEE
jgi:hypothetical protein